MDAGLCSFFTRIMDCHPLHQGHIVVAAAAARAARDLANAELN